MHQFLFSASVRSEFDTKLFVYGGSAPKSLRLELKKKRRRRFRISDPQIGVFRRFSNACVIGIRCHATARVTDSIWRHRGRRRRRRRCCGCCDSFMDGGDRLRKASRQRLAHHLFTPSTSLVRQRYGNNNLSASLPHLAYNCSVTIIT